MTRPDSLETALLALAAAADTAESDEKRWWLPIARALAALPTDSSAPPLGSARLADATTTRLLDASSSIARGVDELVRFARMYGSESEEQSLLEGALRGLRVVGALLPEDACPEMHAALRSLEEEEDAAQ